MKNLNFLAAKVERQAAPEGNLRKPGLLLFRRCAIALHLSQQITAVIFLADFDHVLVGDVAPGVVIMKSRRNQETNRLFDRAGDGFSLLPGNSFRTQRVENHHSFVSGDNAAVEARGRKYVIAGNELS